MRQIYLCAGQPVTKNPESLRRWLVCAVLVCCGLVGVASAQVPGGPGQKSAEPAKRAKYQVDFRLQVASDLDKQRVVIWTNLLKELGAAGVSQVPGEPVPPKPDEPMDPAVESAGLHRVVVRGMLGPSGNLFIGRDAFRIADRVKLAAYIKALQVDGLPAPDPSAPMWGLGREQVEVLQGELGRPSQFEFDGVPFAEFLRELRGRIKLEIKVSPEAERAIGSSKVRVTTGEVSLGAALSYVLSQHALAWEPRHAARGSVALVIMPLEDSKRPWPIGLPPEQSLGNIAPPLMATARYQTNNVPLEEVLDAFRRNLKMDVLLDRAGLIDRGIDPDKLRSTVQIPGGTFVSAIRQTLRPMGLKHEVRLDEANRPFLWVTWSEPTGPKPKQ